MRVLSLGSFSSPDKRKKTSRISLLRSTIRAKNTPINFNVLFEKFFIKEENLLNLKKYLIELYHDLSHFSSKEEKGVSYETFIYFLNMPNPISSNIFKMLDKDNNNYLNLEEFVFGLYDIYGTNSFHKLSNFVFKLFDTDKDGLISKEDIQLTLSYLPLERNLRNKLMNMDFYNITYDDISKNQKLIENTLDSVYLSKHFLNLENFNFSLQKVNSDIFVAVLIYLFESRPFNNDVLKIYSYTDYDYFSENKNSENFKKIDDIFEKNNPKGKEKMNFIKHQFSLLEGQNIEEPKIDFIKDLNIIKNSIRLNQKKYTFAQGSFFKSNKRNKSNQNLIRLRDTSKSKTKHRKSSFLEHMNLPHGYHYKKLSSGNIFALHNINSNEKSILNISDLMKLDSIYESTVFKIANKGKLKTYYIKLVHKDLFYFKSKDNKFHIGMHHLTNNIILSKNKKQKYKAIWLFSLSIINQEKKHTFYFDKEHMMIQWYKHLQKAVFYRKVEDIIILGEKIKSDKIQILRNIKYKENISNYYNKNKKINWNNKDNTFLEDKKYICTQIIKAGNKLSKKLNESIFNQISVFKICYHSNFCKLIDIFQDEKYFYIITEKYSEINILNYLSNLHIHNPLKEEEKICEIIHQVLIAVYYLHKMGIMHRNIKPDSIVPRLKYDPQPSSSNESFSSSDNDSPKNSSSEKTSNINNNETFEFTNIKLIDLSLSKFLNINQKVKEPYGTVGYLSPEMLSDQAYDFRIDEWSIGIVTHLLLCGKLPFSDEYSEKEIARQTIHEQLTFDQPKWEKISKEAKDFVSKLLIKDPKKRMNVKDALVHPWIKKYYPEIVAKRIKYIKDNSDGAGFEFDIFSSPVDLKNE